MPRIDDYINARALTVEELSKKDPEFIADISGGSTEKDSNGIRAILIDFLNRKLIISWPDFEISYRDSEEEMPLQQQVLVVHYLNGACASNGAPITGEWVSYQDIPDGRFYLGSFIARAKDPLINAFGMDPEMLPELASTLYGATRLDHGDHSVLVNALPLLPVGLVIWEGDDEFPPDGNILFDKNISRILSAEDIVWLAGMVVYPLVGMAKKKG